MTAQAPPGWYPDQTGMERYWDGQQWTANVRPPAPPGTPPPGAESSPGRRKNPEDTAADQPGPEGGSLVTKGVFGTSTIELYEGGFVRVASGEKSNLFSANRPGRTFGPPGQPVRIKRSAPFERLRAISFTSGSGTSNGGTNSLERAIGPTASKLMKGGKAAFKGSVPGLAAAGLSHVASTGSRTAHLTIETDHEIHQLTNQSHNGFAKTVLAEHEAVGRALESAGRSLLGQPERSTTSGAATDAPAPSGSESVSSRLRELAQLHHDGVLTDDEYASAKANILGLL